MAYLGDLAIFAVIVALLVTLSWWFRRPGLNVLEATALGLGICLGSFAAVTFICSLARINFVVVIFLWMAGIFFFGKGRLNNLKISLIEIRTGLSGLRGLDLIVAAYLLLAAGLTLMLALAPPGGLDYDSLVYHLAAPRQFLRAGRIVELSYDHHSYFPLGTEMLYMFGLWLRGPVLAKLFHWLMLPLCVVGLVAMGKRHFSLRLGLVAAVFFVSLPVVLCEATTAYIDLALTVYTLLAFLCFFCWHSSGERRWVVLCAVFCGFCLSTKYLGVLTYMWLGLCFLFCMYRQNRFEWKSIACYALVPLLIGGGWYARNILLTGNPVYPFAYEIFGGRGWNLAMAKEYSAQQASWGYGHTLIDWLLVPWRLAMVPVNIVATPQRLFVGMPYWPVSLELSPPPFDGVFETKGMIYQSILGPALLAFTVPLIFIRRKPPVIVMVLATLLFFGLFWAVTGQYLRYLLPALALLCIPCGWAACRFFERGLLLRWTTLTCLFAWAAMSTSLVVRLNGRTIPYVFGKETLAQFQSRGFAGYDAMKWASEYTPVSARFAVFGEPRCFDLDRDYLLADDFHNNLIDYAQIKSWHAMETALHRLGVTHIVWNTRWRAGGGGMGNDPPFITNGVTKGSARRLYTAHGYDVFELQP